MKKFTKFLFTIISIILLSSFFIHQVNAANNEIISTSGDYTLKLYTVNMVNDGYNTFYEGQKLKDYILTGVTVKVLNKNGEVCFGDYAWSNPEYILIKGEQTVEINFTPVQKTPKPVPTTTFTLTINATEVPQKSNRFTDIEIPNNDTDTTQEPQTTLTASTLMLASAKSTYDININNKPDDVESYNWSSSNTKVAKVDSKGIVTSIGDGKATITCEITDSNGNKKELKSKVIVGQDDNFVTLSDAELDLEVGDSQRITLENRVKGSTYKFTSSNKSVLKIATSGKFTALSTGSCDIICVVKNPDDTVIVLKCTVNVE